MQADGQGEDRLPLPRERPGRRAVIVQVAGGAFGALQRGPRSRGVPEQGDRVGLPVSQLGPDWRLGADLEAPPGQFRCLDVVILPPCGLCLHAPCDRLVSPCFLSERQRCRAVSACRVVAAQVSEEQARVGEKQGVGPQQVTGLAEPLPPALQEKPHLLVHPEDFGEDSSRGHARVHLGKIGRRPVQLLDRVIGRVRACYPRHHARGLVRVPVARIDFRFPQAERAVQQLVPLGDLVVAALPAVDHPDQAVKGRDHLACLAGSTPELAGRLGNIPASGPPPCSQRLGVRGHRAYLRVTVVGAERVLQDAPWRAPSCHYPTACVSWQPAVTTLVRVAVGGTT